MLGDHISEPKQQFKIDQRVAAEGQLTTEEQPGGIFYEIKEIQYSDHLKVSRLNKLLLSVPLAKEPVVRSRV